MLQTYLQLKGLYKPFLTLKYLPSVSVAACYQRQTGAQKQSVMEQTRVAVIEHYLMLPIAPSENHSYVLSIIYSPSCTMTIPSYGPCLRRRHPLQYKIAATLGHGLKSQT